METIPRDVSLEYAKIRYAEWRKSRNKRSRIPAELIELALSLRNKYGIGQITSNLGLNHTDFKKRIQNLTDQNPTPAAKFIEIPLSEIPFPKNNDRKGCIEFENPDGYKLRFYAADDIGGKIDKSLNIFFGNRG